MASEDVQTNLRLPAELKESLQAAAARNNRSLSAEVAYRLVHSFTQDASLLQDGEREELRRERDALELRHEVMMGRVRMLETLIALKKQMLSNLAADADMAVIDALREELVSLREELETLADQVLSVRGRISEIVQDLELPEWPDGLKKLANKMPKP